MLNNLVNLVAGGRASDRSSDDRGTHTSHTRRNEARTSVSHDRNPAGGRNDDHSGDKIHDEEYMAKVEERVSSYLERMQQDHANGTFKRIQRKEGGPKVTSWEQLHKIQDHNRHVYFGGAPLGHSIEVVELKRNEIRARKEVEKLEEELRRSTERIEELTNRHATDFHKYELALGKALALGRGCTLIAEVICSHIRDNKRHFFNAMRQRHNMLLQRRLDEQAKALRQKHKLAVLVIVRHIKKLLEPSMKASLRIMRCGPSDKMHTGRSAVAGLIKSQKYIVPEHINAMALKGAQVKQLKNFDNPEERTFASVEQSLLTRLENLVAEEMQMLTTAKYVHT
ncbi:DNA-directed RNA polymerase subunit alpha, putative [Babesia ovata]|uniref:DNA-directed RNA polymerase subunit alpha, putative n=1 Tax=Babesia ovata TaxID=189622 RepID=A0A2H6KDK9_9APIC|nr:DNA-directed RNA polymerase subunit alpha, putative [Babesia ovata]GBE61076.1 DNA-directed RNA polymerase subunit alpha, putative [Babesia ovata]